MRAVEHGLVTVRRAIPEHDLVALVERVIAQLDAVFGDGTTEVLHGRREPNDLFDGTSDVAIEVAHQQLSLVGVLGEELESVARGVAGCLVASGAEQDEERGQFVFGEDLAVDLGIDECRGQIIGRGFAALGDQTMHERGKRGTRVHERFERVGAFGDELGITVRQNDVGHVEDEVVLGLGNAHQVADESQRQTGGNVGNEVDRALVGDAGDNALGLGFDGVIELLEHARRETPGHDAAQASVAGIIHVDHRAIELEHLDRKVGDVRTLPGAEQVWLLAGRDDVGVAHERPVTGARREHVLAVDHQASFFAEEELVLGPELGEHAVADITRAVPEPLNVGKRGLVERCRHVRLHGSEGIRTPDGHDYRPQPRKPSHANLGHVRCFVRDSRRRRASRACAGATELGVTRLSKLPIGLA